MNGLLRQASRMISLSLAAPSSERSARSSGSASSSTSRSEPRTGVGRDQIVDAAHFHAVAGIIENGDVGADDLVFEGPERLAHADEIEIDRDLHIVEARGDKGVTHQGHVVGGVLERCRCLVILVPDQQGDPGGGFSPRAPTRKRPWRKQPATAHGVQVAEQTCSDLREFVRDYYGWPMQIQCQRPRNFNER